MAASMVAKTTLASIRTLWSGALIARPAVALLDNSPVSFVQVRYRNKKQRVKEAKVQEDKNEQFVPKKKKTMKMAIQVETVEKKVQFLAQSPIDNVWIRQHYPPQSYSFEETVEKHKAFAQPAMLNNMQGLVFMDMRLDLTTNKKTKFMPNIRSTLRLPHEFPYGSPPNILVLSKNDNNLELATKLGAKYSGKPESVLKLIQSGVINPKDYEHVLCTAECATEILPLRSYLREKFPQKAKGSLGADLNVLWDFYYNGYTYESQKISDEVGRLQVPLGLLEQPTEELKENFTAYVTDICQHRSIALGPFIQSITVIAPPSPEEFIVKVEDYVPGYKEEDVSDDEEVEGATA
ncbi:hypothetical protein BsWGS_06396 [Bradybaena similaris]